MSAIHLTDGYKLDHRRQYPEGTSLVYSNWTPRMSRITGVNKVVLFGLQYFIMQYLIKEFQFKFFDQQKAEVVNNYYRRVKNFSSKEFADIVTTDHIAALHDLGYLPVVIRAIPEGRSVPLKTPMFIIYNTHPDFFWLVNYLETLISCSLWQPCTSATIGKQFRQTINKWAEKTTDYDDNVKFFTSICAHDFSMRGMSSVETAKLSGAGHLLSHCGSDNLPAIDFLEEFYGASSDNEFIACGVPATEHSVMCAGGAENEFETFKRLIVDLYPTGIVSIVSDTWDLFTVITDYLPRLRDVIMARDGKVVIRPDSGDPADILCGQIQYPSDKLYSEAILSQPEAKGVVQLLWDIFGGTTNSKGLKELHPSIGCIYGDSITHERLEDINRRLEIKGFASINWVAGIGSYTYQYNTRDTFGFAMKATYVEITHQCTCSTVDNTCKGCNGEQPEVRGREIFKAPKTDNGMKNSAKGLLRLDEVDGTYVLTEGVSWEDEGGAMEEVFKDGKLTKFQTLAEIRANILKD